MTWLVPPSDVEEVSARLAQAWEFLSGVSRSFDCLRGTVLPLACAEFSFVMPMVVLAQQRTGGVGVLIERADAVKVAAHMFGHAESAVQESELRDACAEVCNIFSDCIALHVGGDDDVSIGLPAVMDARQFDQINQNSTIAAVYQGRNPSATLHVVVYDVFRQPL